MSKEERGKWPLTQEEVDEWCRKQTWHFARTMSNNPHYYCLRRETNRDMFFMIVLHIREFGYQSRWWGKEYTMLEADGHHMWTMGDAVETTILINRKTNEQVMLDKATGKG